MIWLIGGATVLFLGLIARRLAEYGKQEKPRTAAQCLADMRAINNAYTTQKPGYVYKDAPPGLDFYGRYKHWTTHDHNDVLGYKYRGAFREEVDKGYFGERERQRRDNSKKIWLDQAHDMPIEGHWKE